MTFSSDSVLDAEYESESDANFTHMNSGGALATIARALRMMGHVTVKFRWTTPEFINVVLLVHNHEGRPLISWPGLIMIESSFIRERGAPHPPLYSSWQGRFSHVGKVGYGYPFAASHFPIVLLRCRHWSFCIFIVLKISFCTSEYTKHKINCPYFSKNTLIKP